MGPALRPPSGFLRRRRQGVGSLIGEGGEVKVGDGEIWVGNVKEEVVWYTQKSLGLRPSVVARVWFAGERRDRSARGGRRRCTAAWSGRVHGAPGRWREEENEGWVERTRERERERESRDSRLSGNTISKWKKTENQAKVLISSGYFRDVNCVAGKRDRRIVSISRKKNAGF
jgi:hypothetical protein